MTIEQNVTRLLKFFGLAHDVFVSRVEEDRIFGWSSGELLTYMIRHDWNPDDSWAAKFAHGTKYSFREPGGVQPAMQVCIHPTPDKKGYFVEIDFDFSAPSGGLFSFVRHTGEVLENAITQTKTDQKKIARGLTKRGIPE